VHVLDSCDAVISALKWLYTQQHTCEAFNIAGENYSIQNLLQQIAQVTGTEIKTVDTDYFVAQELDQVAAKAEKAEQLLGWKAKRSLTQMLEDEWRFYQQTLRA
jgi:UDP-glucose 4-epimerase